MSEGPAGVPARGEGLRRGWLGRVPGLVGLLFTGGSVGWGLPAAAWGWEEWGSWWGEGSLSWLGSPGPEGAS